MGATTKGEGKGKFRPWVRHWKGRGKGKGNAAIDCDQDVTVTQEEKPVEEVQMKAEIAGVDNHQKNNNSRKDIFHQSPNGPKIVDHQQQHNYDSRANMTPEDTEEEMRQIGTNFCASLQQLSYKNDEKYELMCAILSELQGRQNILEATVHRIQTVRREMNEQNGNMYSGPYCNTGMVMPMMSQEALMMTHMPPMNMTHMEQLKLLMSQEMPGPVPAEAN